MYSCSVPGYGDVVAVETFCEATLGGICLDIDDDNAHYRHYVKVF